MLNSSPEEGLLFLWNSTAEVPKLGEIRVQKQFTTRDSLITPCLSRLCDSLMIHFKSDSKKPPVLLR